MKNFKNITMVIFGLFAFTNVLSQTIVDHSFSYQGELNDNGVPANGEFDFFIHMVDDQGIETGTGSEHDNIQVTNGLFNLDVKIGGINGFEGFIDHWFEVSVRPGASTASYTVLSPVQKLQAVPLATSLTKGSASTNQVLTFNGFGWAPADPVSSSPWTIAGSDITFSGGLIGISPDGSGTTNATPSNNGMMTIGASSSQLTFDGDDIQRKSNGSPSRLYLNYYGGGVTLADANNITTVRGDIKQPISQNGVMKYMVHLTNCGPSSILSKFSNNVNTGAVTVTNGSTDGQCIINFPTNINDRYWQSSAIFSLGTRGATCDLSDNDKLICKRFDTTTGDGISGGGIMVLIY